MGIRDKHLFASPIKISEEEIESHIKEVALMDDRILVVYLFGPRARGRFNKYSDVDVGVYTSADFSWQDVCLFYEEISKGLASDRLDVVWLNKADAIFLMDVLKHGKVIFYRDRHKLDEWELLVRKMYRDSLVLRKKVEAIRGVSVGDISINKRIEALLRYREDLSSLLDGVELFQYKSDLRVKYAVERLCYLCCEAILDCLEHILVKEFGVEAFSYGEILELSYEKGILSEDLYGALQGISGFRNILAHSYLDIDDELVYSNARKMVMVIPDLIKLLEGWGR